MDSDFDLILHKFGCGNPGATATVFRLIGSDYQDINDDNIRMLNILHSKGIHGAALYLIYNDGCNRSSAKCNLALKAILDGTINMTNLQIAILKEDKELFQDLFKEIKA